jgi:peptidoglycan/xylan/chitin deacetylase (PgdA/CDA1 family)
MAASMKFRDYLANLIRNSLQETLFFIDRRLARAHLPIWKESSGLVSFLFHGLFRNREEIDQGHADPQQRTTVKALEEVIQHMSGNGYEFVTPDQILSGLPALGRYAWLTFDDGYFSSTHALPVMEKYQIPATFFVSTRSVLENRSFWWDALYRLRLKWTLAERTVELRKIKTLRYDLLENELMNLGADFTPVSDIDRPMTPTELKKLSQHPLACIGNHTHDHAVLTHLPRESAREQIQKAQDCLKQICGQAPIVIAYPDGVTSRDIADLASSLGLRLGITTVARKDTLPLQQAHNYPMLLSRFIVDSRIGHLGNQLQQARSDFPIYHRGKNFAQRILHGP